MVIAVFSGEGSSPEPPARSPRFEGDVAQRQGERIAGGVNKFRLWTRIIAPCSVLGAASRHTPKSGSRQNRREYVALPAGQASMCAQGLCVNRNVLYTEPVQHDALRLTSDTLPLSLCDIRGDAQVGNWFPHKIKI